MFQPPLRNISPPQIQKLVSRKQPCPVCQKTHGCLLYETQVVCLRIPSEKPAIGGLGGWIHSLAEPALFQAALQAFIQPSQRLAPPATLDRVYRALHTHLVLNAAHLKHLTQERQLTPKTIKARGYQSWGHADWTPNLKGLDDLLLAGGVPKLTPYQVSGNGKRPFESVPTPDRPKQKAMHLGEAREHVKTRLRQALHGDLGPPEELGILLSSLPGSGKSTILTQVLNDYHRASPGIVRLELSTQWVPVQATPGTQNGENLPYMNHLRKGKDSSRMRDDP